MSEAREFGRMLADMEGDATVQAGARHSTYAARHAFKRPVREGAGAFERELDEALAQVRTKAHEAISSATVETIQLEVSVLEDVWRLRLVQKRGEKDVLSIAVNEATLAQGRR